MLDDLINTSNLKYSEMLRPNSQKQRNLTPNLKNDLVDIETHLDKFPNILQQKKRAFKIWS